MQDRSPPSGNSSFCIMLPRRNSELPSTLALALAATCTARLRGRCFVPTSATDSLQRAPDSDRAVPSVRVACASGTPRRSKLREATRVIERLTAPYELRKACGFTLGRIGPYFTGDSTSRANPFLIGDLIMVPSGSPLVSRRCLPRDRRAVLPLTPCRSDLFTEVSKSLLDLALQRVSSKTPLPATPRRLPSTNVHSIQALRPGPRA